MSLSTLLDYSAPYPWRQIFGVVLNDGTPIRSVEVKIDSGRWQAATLDPETMSEKYSWKFFTFDWQSATPGEHTVM